MRSKGIRTLIMSEKTSSKTALRRLLLAQRQAIAEEVRNEWNATISSRVATWFDTHPTQTLGVYWPIRDEPDLHSAYKELYLRGIQLALPVVVAKDAPLRFIAWKPGDEMTTDALGVMIPMSGDVRQPDTLLVPCVGFNNECYRLGYGGGFYDRILAASSRPHAIGISYAYAFATFETDAHDIALDAVITEKFVIPSIKPS